MKLLCLSLFLGSTLFASGLSAQSLNQDDPQSNPIAQDSMPQWEKEDLDKFLQGEAFAGEDLVPQEDEQPDPEIAGMTTIETPVEDNDHSMDPSVIATGLLPLYNPQDKNQLLIDPQSILSSQESADIAKLLLDIKEVTGVSVYLTVFDKNQKIPPALNAPTLSREIFGDREGVLLVEYRLDEFLKTQLIYSKDMGTALDTEKKKKILDFIQVRAAEFTDSQERLWHLLYFLGKQIPSIQAYAKKADHTSEIIMPNLDYPSPAKVESKGKESINILEVFKNFLFTYGPPVLISLLTGVLIIGGFLYWQSKKVYPLSSHHGPSDKRLGAPNGTNTARVLYYSRQTKKSKKEEERLKEFFNFKQP